MTTYKIIFTDCSEIDAIALMCGGNYRNTVKAYDGTNDIGFIEVPDENAEYLEEILEEDDKVIEYTDVPNMD